MFASRCLSNFKYNRQEIWTPASGRQENFVGGLSLLNKSRAIARKPREAV